jgi:hypothetical protein
MGLRPAIAAESPDPRLNAVIKSCLQGADRADIAQESPT